MSFQTNWVSVNTRREARNTRDSCSVLKSWSENLRLSSEASDFDRDSRETSDTCRWNTLIFDISSDCSKLVRGTFKESVPESSTYMRWSRSQYLRRGVYKLSPTPHAHRNCKCACVDMRISSLLLSLSRDEWVAINPNLFRRHCEHSFVGLEVSNFIKAWENVDLPHYCHVICKSEL